MQLMKIGSRVHDYEVHFPEAVEFLPKLEAIPERLYVIDENVWRLHGGGCLAGLDPGNVFLFPVNEERKTLEGVTEVYDRLLARAAKRNMTLISIGGGIVQDVTGFAASTLYRGIRWVFIPTTLLAQADSCIGGKTSLNYKGFKNLAGTFYPPHEVYVSPVFLATLKEADYYSGLGEVVKLHLMSGEEATRAYRADQEAIHGRDPQVLSKVIRASLEIKKSFMEGDEFDMGRRNLLNFGHCYGHALESTSDFAVPHGQAVLIGMLFANLVARGRGLLSAAACAEIDSGLIREHIRVLPKQEHLDAGRIAEAMKKDKKRTGAGLALVMMTEGRGMVKVGDMTTDELAEANRQLAERLGRGNPGDAGIRIPRAEDSGSAAHRLA